MARKVMPMRVQAAVVAVAAGERVNVSEVCRQAGVSRQCFYEHVRRVRVEGVEGLQPRSRRPHRFPRQTASTVEDAIVLRRKELQDAGLDHGATTIQWHLGRDESLRGRVPSVATIHRVLVRRGLVLPQPEKRPKSSWRRFEAPAPNEWWQTDYFDWVIATGSVKVFNFVDDHSRVAVRSRAVLEATADEAWATLCQAAPVWGLPAGVLSDNGLCFSGKLRGFEVHFETKLREAGVRPFTGRPYHPQTTGKVERFQQTLKKWLRRLPLAATIDVLQAQLDEFCRIYNHERPHQGIGRVTPISRWQASPRSTPASAPLPAPVFACGAKTFKVNENGVFRVDPDFVIHVGACWHGMDAIVVIDASDWVTVIINGELVRHFKLDRSRHYQPSGQRPGGPRQPRRLRS
jgi:transposase InsO family protein